MKDPAMTIGSEPRPVCALADVVRFGDRRSDASHRALLEQGHYEESLLRNYVMGIGYQ